MKERGGKRREGKGREGRGRKGREKRGRKGRRGEEREGKKENTVNATKNNHHHQKPLLWNHHSRIEKNMRTFFLQNPSILLSANH